MNLYYKAYFGTFQSGQNTGVATFQGSCVHCIGFVLVGQHHKSWPLELPEAMHMQLILQYFQTEVYTIELCIEIICLTTVFASSTTSAAPCMVCGEPP